MKRFSKISSILLSAILVLSSTGCGGQSASVVKEKPQEVSTEEKNDLTPDGKLENALTLTTVKGIHTNPKFPEGDTEKDNAMIKAIKDKLNIDINILWQSNDYDNKLALSIASGDIPDMFYLDTKKYLMYKNLLDNDMLADLTDAVTNNSGHYLKQITEKLDGKNYEALTKDGKIYGVGSTNLGYGHNILWIRKDWLEKYNLELPKTIDDVTHIAKTFIENDAGEKGAGKTLGIVTGDTDFITTQYGLNPVFQSFGSYPKQWMKTEKCIMAL